MLTVPNKTRDDYDFIKVYNPHNAPIDIFHDGMLIQTYYKVTNDGINTEIFFKKGALPVGKHISYKIASDKRKRYDYYSTPETIGFIMLPFNPETVSNLEVYINGVRTVDIKKEDTNARVTFTNYNNIHYLFIRDKMSAYSRISVMYGNHEYDNEATLPYSDSIPVTGYTVDYFKTDLWLDGKLLIPNIHYKIIGNSHILFNKGTTGTEIKLYNEKYPEIYPETDTSYDKLLLSTITDLDQLRPTQYIHGTINTMIDLILFTSFVIYVTTVLKAEPNSYITGEKNDMPFDELESHMIQRVDAPLDDEIRQSYPSASSLLKGVSIANTLINDKGNYDYTFMKIGFMTSFRIYNGIDEIIQEKNFNTDGYYYLWTNSSNVDNVDGVNSPKGNIHGDRYKPELKYIIKEQQTLDDIYNKPTIIQLVLNLDKVNKIISSITDYRIHDEFSIISKEIQLYYIDGNNNRSLVESLELGKHNTFTSNGDGVYQAEVDITYKNNAGESHVVKQLSNSILIWSPPILNIVDQHVLDTSVSVDTNVILGNGNNAISYLTELVDVNTNKPIAIYTKHQISPNTIYQNLPEGEYYIRFTLKYNFLDNSVTPPTSVLKPSITANSPTFNIIGLPSIDKVTLTSDLDTGTLGISYFVDSNNHIIIKQQIGVMYDDGSVHTGNDIGNPFEMITLSGRDATTDTENAITYDNLSKRYGKFKVVMIVSYESTVTGVTKELHLFSNTAELYANPEILDFDILKRDDKLHLVGGDTISYKYDNKHISDIQLSLSLDSETYNMNPINVSGFNVETGFASHTLRGSQYYKLTATMKYKITGSSTVHSISKSNVIFTDYDIGKISSVHITHIDGGLKLSNLVYEIYDASSIAITVALTNGLGIQVYKKTLSPTSFDGNGLELNVAPGKYNMAITGEVTSIGTNPTGENISQVVEVYKFPSTGTPTLSNNIKELGKTFDYEIPTPDINDKDTLIIDHANIKLVLYSYDNDIKGGVVAEIPYTTDRGIITANYDQTKVILEIHVPYSVDGVNMPMYVNSSLGCKVELPPTITSITLTKPTTKNEIDLDTVFNNGIGYNITDSGIKILDDTMSEIKDTKGQVLRTFALLSTLAITDDTLMQELPLKIIARAYINYTDDNGVPHEVHKDTPVTSYIYIHEDKIDIRHKTFPVSIDTSVAVPTTDVTFNIDIFLGNNTLDISNSYIYMSSTDKGDTIDLDGETPKIETTYQATVSSNKVNGGIHKMIGGPFVLGTTVQDRIISGNYHIYGHLTYTNVFGSKKVEIVDLGTIDINNISKFVLQNNKIFTYEYIVDIVKPHPSPTDVLVIDNKSIASETGTQLDISIKPLPIGETIDNIYDSKRVLVNTLANIVPYTQSYNIDKGFNDKRISVPLDKFVNMFKLITGVIGRDDMLMGLEIELKIMQGTNELVKDSMNIIYPKFTEILNLPKLVEVPGKYGNTELSLDGFKTSMHQDSPVTNFNVVLTKVNDADPDIDYVVDILPNIINNNHDYPFVVPENKQEFYINYNVVSTLGNWTPNIDSIKSSIKYSFEYIAPNNPDPLILSNIAEILTVDNTGVDLGKNVLITDASIKVYDYTGDKIGIQIFNKDLPTAMKNNNYGKYANGKYLVRRYIDHILLDKIGDPNATPPVLPDVPYVEKPIEFTKSVTLNKPIVKVIDTEHISVSGLGVLDPDGLYPTPSMKVTLTDIDGKDITPAVFKVLSAPYPDIVSWKLEAGKAYRVKCTLNNEINTFSDLFSLKRLPEISHITTALNGHDITASIDITDTDGTLSSLSMHLVNYLGADLRPPVTTSSGTVVHFDSVPDNNAYFIKAVVTDESGITVSKTEPVYGLNNKLYTHQGTIKLKNIDYTAIRGTVPLEEEISDIIESFKPIISNTNQDININNIAISDPVGDSIGTDYRVELLDENGDPLLPVHVETLPLTTTSHLIHAPSPLKYKVRISTGMISYISEVLDCSKAFVINPPNCEFSFTSRNLYVRNLSLIDPKGLSTSDSYEVELLYMDGKQFNPRRVVTSTKTIAQAQFDHLDEGIYKVGVNIDGVSYISDHYVDAIVSRFYSVVNNNGEHSIIVDKMQSNFDIINNHETMVLDLCTSHGTTDPALASHIIPIGMEKIIIPTPNTSTSLIYYRIVLYNNTRTMCYTSPSVQG